MTCHSGMSKALESVSFAHIHFPVAEVPVNVIAESFDVERILIIVINHASSAPSEHKVRHRAQTEGFSQNECDWPCVYSFPGSTDHLSYPRRHA